MLNILLYIPSSLYIIIKYIFIGIFIPLIISLIAYIYLQIKFYFFRKIKNFKNKHVLILGASSGLGEALSYILTPINFLFIKILKK